MQHFYLIKPRTLLKHTHIYITVWFHWLSLDCYKCGSKLFFLISLKQNTVWYNIDNHQKLIRLLHPFLNKSINIIMDHCYSRNSIGQQMIYLILKILCSFYYYYYYLLCPLGYLPFALSSHIIKKKKESLQWTYTIFIYRLNSVK